MLSPDRAAEAHFHLYRHFPGESQGDYQPSAYGLALQSAAPGELRCNDLRSSLSQRRLLSGIGMLHRLRNTRSKYMPVPTAA